MSRVAWLLLCVPAVCAVCAWSSPTSPYVSSHEDVYNVAAVVANKHFDGSYSTLLYSHDRVVSQDLYFFIRNYKGCILNQLGYDESARQLSFPMHRQCFISQYIIKIVYFKDLEHALKVMRDQWLFFNTGKFIIICKHKTNPRYVCNAKVIFDICWNYRVANVVLVHNDENEKINVATYFPLSSGQCDNTDPTALYTISKVEEFASLVNVFPKKFRNFNKCPLFVSTFHFPPALTVERDAQKGIKLGGRTGPLIHMMTEILNATLQLVQPRDVQSPDQSNGTLWAGSLDDVFKKRVNISIISSYVTTQRMSVLRTAYPRRMISFVWIAPPSRLRPAWEKLMNPFDPQLRVCLSFFLLLTFVSMVMIRETKLQHLWNSYFVHDPMTGGVYSNTCAIFLGQVSRYRPKKIVLSFVLALWLWFTFVMRSAYQGALVGALKRDAYEPPFNTLRDAVKADFEFGGPKEMINCLADEPDLQKLYKIASRNSSHYFDKMANGSLHFVLLASLQKVSEYNLLSKKEDQLNIVPQFGIVIPNGNYLPPDSLLVDTIDAAYARILASGFEAKLSKEYNFVKKFSYSTRLTKTEDNLTMHNMEVCFVVLALGYVSSAVVFLIELLWRKFRSSDISVRVSRVNTF